MLHKIYEIQDNGYYFCDKYNRFGWAWTPNVKRGNTKTGKAFPIRGPEQCIDFDDFISQFIISKSGKYYRVSHKYFGGREYLHRICWRFHNNWQEIPKGMYIDHINGDITMNTIENLRLVTPIQSAINRENKSNLPKGVSFRKDRQKYVARYKGKYLGSFLRVQEAELAVINEAKADKSIEYWRN